MYGISLVKFMTKEELVNMVSYIMDYNNEQANKYDSFAEAYCIGGDEWREWASLHRSFKLERLDYEDVFLFEDGGYVRYNAGFMEYFAELLKKKFGFVEE